MYVAEKPPLRAPWTRQRKERLQCEWLRPLLEQPAVAQQALLLYSVALHLASPCILSLINHPI